MEKVVMVTLMLTRNDYVPNPSSSHKYEVNVSVDGDDHEDDDDDYDKATTVAQTAPEPR